MDTQSQTLTYAEAQPTIPLGASMVRRPRGGVEPCTTTVSISGASTPQIATNLSRRGRGCKEELENEI